MADKNIGALPQAAQLDDDSLLVVEQQGQAMKMTGAQFKEFGKQAVIGQVQDYVDAAEAAAAQAVDAVRAVTDMTVEAQTLASGQSASVTKSMKGGTVNLAFGLPRGERGEAGPEGQTGPRGPKGDPGNGLTILGHYDTEAELRAAVPSPEVGDPYSVGTQLPYDTYIFDGVTLDWKNYGPFTGGGGGGPLPENVVTSEGGASLEIPAGFGEAPHVISFDDEEEPPITAGDVAYSDTQTVKEAIDGLKSSVSNGKSLVASAITDKGVPTAQDATFAQMAEHIGQIASGSDTSDATATPGDILAPKTAYTAAGKVEGVIPTIPARTITPGTADQTIANGQYLGGTQTIKGDPNLASANIKSGVSIFGVSGALESTFQATLTVTADVGAVVSATHTNGTELEALSTTGSVTLELPMEGQWTVTARRGTAQYNSVVINVSSSYSAALTAEVHIQYFGSSSIESRQELAAVSIGNYAFFCGGYYKYPYLSNEDKRTVDYFDGNLTKGKADDLSNKGTVTAAAVGGYAVITKNVNSIDAYNSELTHTTRTNSTSGTVRVSAPIGDFAIFGGSQFYALDGALTLRPIVAPATIGQEAAAANQNYAIFCGNAPNGTAYNKALTREIISGLSETRHYHSAARAGNYVVFAGGINGGSLLDTVDAYDLFLTRTTPERLSVARYQMAGTDLKENAIFCGGRNDAVLKCVDAYDAFLTHTTPEDLGNRSYLFAGVSINEYALFGGGADFQMSYGNVSIYRYV